MPMHVKFEIMDSSSEEEYEEALLLLALYHRCKHNKKQKRFWVQPIISQQRQHGSFSTLVQEIRLFNAQLHFQYFQMTKEKFDDLLHRVKTFISIHYYCYFNVNCFAAF